MTTINMTGRVACELRDHLNRVLGLGAPLQDGVAMYFVKTVKPRVVVVKIGG